jgi:hypothetical protein
MLKVITIAAATIVAGSAAALAHDTRPIDRTQDRQAERIEQGRYSGELTRREYVRLKAEQARIAELERRAKADGIVTGSEYRAIREAQREASRHIYDETHDNQRSFWRRWLYVNR